MTHRVWYKWYPQLQGRLEAVLDQVAPVIVSPVWLSPSSIGAGHGYHRRLPRDTFAAEP
jgi:hypothetical protein